MDRQTELGIIRAAYAKQILAAARVVDARLEAAFGAIRREDFLGPGPWSVLRWFREYVVTPDADPVYIYTDDLVGISTERRINNGQPSLHARLIRHAAPTAGGHVVHIGTGTGYYTAILAQLTGPSGRVTGIEYDGELAARAKANLAPAGIRHAYRIETAWAGDIETSRVVWITPGSDAAAPRSQPSAPPPAIYTKAAEAWLAGRLAEGPVQVSALEKWAGESSIARASLYRAATALKVIRTPSPGGGKAWQLRNR